MESAVSRVFLSIFKQNTGKVAMGFTELICYLLHSSESLLTFVFWIELNFSVNFHWFYYFRFNYFWFYYFWYHYFLVFLFLGFSVFGWFLLFWCFSPFFDWICDTHSTAFSRPTEIFTCVFLLFLVIVFLLLPITVFRIIREWTCLC